MRVLRWLKAIAGFWVDFIVGDDWTVAAAVAVALVGTWGLRQAQLPAWLLPPAAVVTATAVSLRRAVRRPSR